MRYRRLTSRGDYSFGHGRDEYTSGADAVGQAVKTRLLLLLGEWWEDISDGLPLFQHILGARYTPDNKQGIDLIVQSRIAETPEVIAIKDYQSSFDSIKRALKITCTIDTPYGGGRVEVVY